MDLTGEWLRLVKKLDPLPVGIVVYCIVDEGHQFRVRTSQAYHGVCEFIYNPDKKDRFVLYV